MSTFLFDFCTLLQKQSKFWTKDELDEYLKPKDKNEGASEVPYFSHSGVIRVAGNHSHDGEKDGRLHEVKEAFALAKTKTWKTEHKIYQAFPELDKLRELTKVDDLNRVIQPCDISLNVKGQIRWLDVVRETVVDAFPKYDDLVRALKDPEYYERQKSLFADTVENLINIEISQEKFNRLTVEQREQILEKMKPSNVFHGDVYAMGSPMGYIEIPNANFDEAFGFALISRGKPTYRLKHDYIKRLISFEVASSLVESILHSDEASHRFLLSP